ncbi:hypothetical protein PBI_SCTP2_88 [Salicola phage SCTP-2]|nr:hypothetical protein PBI_SCTP2_88 [Salicola phage SCTP-2]
MSALQKYYRKPKFYFTLPSQLNFYNEGDIDKSEELSILGEVGVMPMTTMNELELKNPESIINGSAVESLIRDCTTLNINPKKLIKSDVDALLVGIKMASNSSTTYNFSVTCPNEECGHQFEYTRDLDKILNSIDTLDEQYTVELSQDESTLLTVYLRPSLYEEHIDVDNQHFKERKRLREIENKINNLTEEEFESEDFEDQKTRFYGMLGEVFKDMSQSAIETYAKNILYVHVKDDNEGVDEYVDDYDEIVQWMYDLDTDSYMSIKDKISEINNKGLDDTETITCQECGHEWNQIFDINLTDFFENGS